MVEADEVEQAECTDVRTEREREPWDGRMEGICGSGADPGEPQDEDGDGRRPKDGEAEGEAKTAESSA